MKPDMNKKPRTRKLARKRKIGKERKQKINKGRKKKIEELRKSNKDLQLRRNRGGERATLAGPSSRKKKRTLGQTRRF